MAKRRGFTFVVIGLLLGVLVGFGIQEVKRRIGEALVEMLEKEAFSSSGCHFSTDEVRVSFLTQRAIAINPRIECEGVPHLTFKKIVARFNLLRIREHIIDLELKLIDGTTLGFSNESTTFKFIDSLAAPIAPERDTPDRYKIKLQRLSVTNLDAIDTVSSRRLLASGATLEMVRTPSNDFSLAPFIPTFTIEDQGRSYSINDISSAMELTDQQIFFRKFHANFEKLEFLGDLALSNDSSSTLAGRISINADLHKVSPLLGGTLTAPIDVSGSIYRLLLNGSAATKNLSIKGIAATEELYAVFQSDINKKVQISKLSFGLAFMRVFLANPISFDSERLFGTVTAQFIGDYTGQLSAELSGIPTNPSVRLTGGAKSAQGTNLQASLVASSLSTQPNISGSGSISVEGVPRIDLALENIENSKVKLRLNGADNSITGNAILDYENGAGELKVGFTSALIAQQVPCGELDGGINYSWNSGEIYSGTGSLKLKSLSGGCNFNVTKLQSGIELPIEAGVLKLKGLSLSSLGKPLVVSGTVDAHSGLNVTASGIIDLTTIRSLVPNIDEISGIGEGSIQVAGLGSSLRVSGKIDVRNARVEQAKAGIEISKVSGPISISNNVLTIDGLIGNFNGGTMTVTGEVNIGDLSQSSARMVAKGFAFEPSNNFSLSASGDIVIEQLQGMPRLTGDLSIDSGEFSDTITLSQIIRLIEKALLSKRTAASTNSLPLLGLNLSIKGTRNLYINTNLGAGELATDLKVLGTLREPLISGEINLRSGWIGFQNRRFEINSGRLIFTPPELEPSIELTAEAILPARTGENVLVILRGRGRVSSPQISLTSDQPITERELLNLISSGTSFTSRTRANTIGTSSYSDNVPLLEELARFRLSKFFTRLVDVDSLSVAPIFNSNTGLIEPALVAEKLLADSLTLFGESTLSGTEGIARARLQLDLSENLALGGLIEDDPTRSGVPTELQFTYTPLSRHARRVNVNITGNEEISDKEILRGLRLSNTSYVTPEDLTSLEADLKNLYAREGFPSMTVKISCDEFVDTCTSINLVIDEGSPQFVTSIYFAGDQLPAAISPTVRETLTKTPKNQRSTEAFKAERSRAFITALRSEGFIAARVESDYKCNTASCDLVLTADPGHPITLIFRGNKIFSEIDFLNAIRLFERTQPFGNNTIAVLVSTIERMYREKGLLFATVTYDETENVKDGRTIFILSIDEGPKVRVANVKFEGVSEQIKNSALEAISYQERADLLKPELPITEQIDSNAIILSEALKTLGYLEVTVEGKIDPIGDTNTADIIYSVELGQRSERVIPHFQNWPAEVPIPVDLTAPNFEAHFPVIGERAQQVLKSEGFLNASVAPRSTSLETLVFEPGERTVIKSIEVRGNPTISQKVILDASGLRVGDPMSLDRIDAARARLLQLGLFARVSINAPPTGEILLDVLERTPRNLEIGSGVNSEYGFHLFGEAADRAIFGDGRQLALRLDGYYDSADGSISKGTASAQFRAPLVFGSDFGLSNDLRFQRFDLATLPYDLDRWSFSSFLSGAHNVWTYSFGHSFIADRLDNVEPDAVLSSDDTGAVNIGSLSGTISYDNRDAPLNPQSGFLLSLDSKLASPIFGSAVNFFELSPRFSWARAIETQWGVAYQLRLGMREPFGSTNEVPITQRYFTGGRTTVRGYDENSLGPRGEFGSEQGGRYLVNQNAELRYKPVEAVAVLWFLDSGSVFLDPPTANDLRHSTGVGIRYLSPVGPIGFDVGFPIQKRSDEDTYRIHFSIGTIF